MMGVTENLEVDEVENDESSKLKYKLLERNKLFFGLPFYKINIASVGFEPTKTIVPFSEIDFKDFSLYTIGNGLNVGDALVQAFVQENVVKENEIVRVVCQGDYDVGIQGVLLRDFTGFNKETLDSTIIRRINEMAIQEGVLPCAEVEGEYYIGNQNIGYNISYCSVLRRK